MGKKRKLSLIIISILGLLDVIFLPVFSAFGGLFPISVEMSFFEVISAVFNTKGAFELWAVRFTMAISFAFIVLIIAALTADKIIFIVTDILSIILVLVQIVLYSLQTKGVQNLFDLKSTSVSIGTWIALLLLFSLLFLAFYKIKTKNETTDVATNDTN